MSIPNKQNILEIAEDLVTGDRTKAYGTPSENFGRWRDLCRASGRPNLKCITSEDIAVLMILGKIARDTNAPKRDNIIDAAGYAYVWDMVRGE